jgi:O-antigen/teichoic acid export membrane protein
VIMKCVPPLEPAKSFHMSLKTNVIANYFGQGWQALMGVAFVPLYIKYLGMESYGLIAIFAMLQVWLALLDMGMKPALAREMARFTGGAHSPQSIRDLLRSIELIGIAVAAVIVLGVWAASGSLATHWVTAKHLPPAVMAHAFAIMGLVTALRFLQDIYASCCVGLQRQVHQNIVLGATSAVRGLGAVALLAWASPTIEAFFLWQGLVSVFTIALFVGIVYRALPLAPRTARFSALALKNVWRFAAGVMAITLLALLFSQVDKILLSRQLTLESFGYYALAGLVANSLTILTGPITTALYPRFTELHTNHDEIALRHLYHQGAQMVTILAGSAAVILMMFGEAVLLLWTQDPLLSRHVAPLMAILVFSTLLNSVLCIPYQLQLAHGWTSLTVVVNIIAVISMVPAILWVVPIYGTIGAAWMLATTNAGCLLLEIPLMHRRLLRADQWRWCSLDVAAPLTAATAVALLCRWAMPHEMGKAGEFGALLAASACILAAAVAAAPLVRQEITRRLGWSRPAC